MPKTNRKHTQTKEVPAEKPEDLQLLEKVEEQAIKAQLIAEAQEAERPPAVMPLPPRRPYQRQRLKKQFTVRIDEELSKAVLARASSEGLRLTDAIEESLWFWIQRKQHRKIPLRGRFLWNVIPLDLQKLTLSFWSFLENAERRPVDDAFRKVMRDVLWSFREDPAYLPGLEGLGRLPGEDEED